MKKEKYSSCDLELIRFKANDVLLSSDDPDYEDDELPFVSNNS